MTEMTALEVPIRFADVDALGHVNHAKYLTYCEEFRVLALQMLDAATPGGPKWLGSSVIARAKVDYLTPINAGRTRARVTGEIFRVGGSSVEMRNRVYADDHLCAVVDVVLVHIGDDGRASPMSEAQRAWWLRHLSTEAKPQLMLLDPEHARAPGTVRIRDR